MNRVMSVYSQVEILELLHKFIEVMKVTWKPPIQQSIHTLLVNLSKEDILPSFKKSYQRSMTETGVWKQYDQQTKQFYSKQFKKPFNYFQEQEYKKQKEVAKLASRLKNREECVDYFSWEGTKLFFKDREMDPDPEENYRQNPFFVFSNFDRKAFISGTYDDVLSSYAEMNIDNEKLLRPRYSLNQLRSTTEQPCKLSKSLKRKPESLNITVTKQQKNYSPLIRKNTIGYLRSPALKKRGSNRNTILNSGGFEMQKSWRINEFQRSQLEIDETQLIERMKLISQNPMSTKSSARVYKQQLRTVFTDRYGQDNFTSFFGIDYILGYPQMEELTKRILDMDQEAITYMCFNILDSDHDGELSDMDLFQLLEHSKDNQLLEADYLKIAQYCLQSTNHEISRSATNQFPMNQLPTYLSFMNRKRSSNLQQQLSPQKPQKFFTLLQQTKSSGRLKKKSSKRSQRCTVSNQSRTLHYQMYKNIFKINLPMMYYDVVFVVSGIRMNRLRYQDLKQPVTALVKVEKDPNMEYPMRKGKYFRLRSNMRDTANNLPRVRT